MGTDGRTAFPVSLVSLVLSLKSDRQRMYFSCQSTRNWLGGEAQMPSNQPNRRRRGSTKRTLVVLPHSRDTMLPTRGTHVCANLYRTAIHNRPVQPAPARTHRPTASTATSLRHGTTLSRKKPFGPFPLDADANTAGLPPPPPSPNPSSGVPPVEPAPSILKTAVWKGNQGLPEVPPRGHPGRGHGQRHCV